MVPNGGMNESVSMPNDAENRAITQERTFYLGRDTTGDTCLDVWVGNLANPIPQPKASPLVFTKNESHRNNMLQKQTCVVFVLPSRECDTSMRLCHCGRKISAATEGVPALNCVNGGGELVRNGRVKSEVYTARLHFCVLSTATGLC